MKKHKSLQIPKLKKRNGSFTKKLKKANESSAVPKSEKLRKKKNKKPGNPSKKIKKINDKTMSIENTNFGINPKTVSKLKLKDNKYNNSEDKKSSLKSLKKVNYENFQQKIKKINMLEFNDFELNTMNYKLALEIDKRTYFEYYLSLLRTKHPIVFSFFPAKDYNVFIIKMCLFFLSFVLYYFFNTLFFDFSIIHAIYKNNGNYDFFILLPNIILSFIITYILMIFIKLFFLSERDILKIKNENNLVQATNKVSGIQRWLIIKNFLYFIVSIIFLGFFWFYLSSFSAVYQNSQFHLIKNVFFSFGFGIIAPFLINLIPGIFRIYSLNNKNSQFSYKISLLVQLL